MALSDLYSTVERRRVMFTGMWAMPLMALGLVLFVLPTIVFLLVVLVIVGGGFLAGGAAAGSLFVGVLTVMMGGVIAVTQPWLIVVPMTIGLAALVGGSWGSVWMLRALGLRSPRAITWSAFGVGFATQVVVSGFLWVVMLLISGLLSSEPVPVFLGVEDGLLSPHQLVFHSIMLVLTAGIGMLYWPLFARASERRAAARTAVAQGATSS